MYHQKPFSRCQALKIKFPRRKRKYRFPQCHKKMENNRIRDIIVDHFIIKKEAICHIPVTGDTEVMKPFTQSVKHGKYDKRILMVVIATNMKQKKFN